MAAAASSNGDLSDCFQKLQEELQCPLCLDYFEDPVTLACQHNFCRNCIGGVREFAGQRQITCPLCRVNTELKGDDGVAKLPRNFHLAGIVEKFLSVEHERRRFGGAPQRQIQHSSQDKQQQQQQEQIGQHQELHPLWQQQQHRRRQRRQHRQRQPQEDPQLRQQLRAHPMGDQQQLCSAVMAVHTVAQKRQQQFQQQFQQQLRHQTEQQRQLRQHVQQMLQQQRQHRQQLVGQLQQQAREFRAEHRMQLHQNLQQIRQQHSDAMEHLQH